MLFTEEQYDYILINVSRTIALSRILSKEINDIYFQNKYYYYTMAKEFRFYQHNRVTSLALPVEIVVKRAIGVLLAAEKDELLKDKIIRILNKEYKIANEFIKNPSTKTGKAFLEFITRKLIPKGVFTGRGDGIEMYFYAHYYSEKSELPQLLLAGFDSMLDSYNELLKNNEDENEYWNTLDQLITVNDREFLETFQSSADIELYSRLHSDDTLPGIDFSKYESYEQTAGAKLRLKELRAAQRSFGRILSICGLDKESIVVDSIKLESEIQRKIIQASCPGKGDRFTFSPTYYVYNLMLYYVCNQYLNTKREYFQTNVETYYLEEHQFQIENEDLKKQINILQQELEKTKRECNVLRERIDRISNDQDNVTLKISKRYNGTINGLNQQINNIKSNESELYKLREFVFSLTSEQNYRSNIAKAPLESLLKGQKIALIGGHSQWRAKMKSKYPDLIIFDGTQESADLTVLQGASYVFLYPAYMSHAMYYKVMAALQQTQCKFGYVGKTNLELVEEEMVDILTSNK